MPSLTLLGPPEMARTLADRIRALRLLRGWTRGTLARRAGVSESSLKRFETTGRASLALVLEVAHALARLEELAQLFQPPPAQSIAELEARAGTQPRRRGRL